MPNVKVGAWWLKYGVVFQQLGKKKDFVCLTIPRDYEQFHTPNFAGTGRGQPSIVPTKIETNAQRQVHKDLKKRVWRG